MKKSPLPLISVITAAALAAMFFYSLTGGPSARGDVLRTDLSECAAYIKKGFEPAYASISDPSSTIWDAELPAGQGRSLVMKRVLKGERRGLFSPKGRNVEEYTILIPFNFSREKINLLYSENSVQPGIYLAGIGENWEIFLNGEPVAKQIYLSADGDKILKYKSERGVSIPFERRFLRTGVNHIVVHIVAVAGSSYAGLFYTAPYYIGDYSRVSYAGGSFFTTAVCTVYFFLGLYHILLFFLRRSDRYNLFFGMFSCFVATYFFSRSPVVYRLFSDTEYSQKLEYATLYIAPLLLACFLEVLHYDKIRPVTKAYGIFCAAAIAVQTAMPLWLSDEVLTLWHAVGILFLAYIAGYNVIYAFIADFKAKARKGGALIPLIIRNLRDMELGNVLLLMTLAILSGIYDILDTVLFQTGIVLTQYTFLGFMLIMAFMLARKYANRYDTTAQMNDALEGVVRKRTQELRDQIIIAESASRAKGEFLANMSHEIRTPLNAVIGMTSIGAKSGDLSGKDYAFDKIQQASHHLLGVINDILDMSKIESGKLELNETVFSVRDVVSRVETVMRFKTNEKKQMFSVNVEREVPEAVRADDLRLAQVITNLLGNAVKFTPEGGLITLSVVWGGEAEGGVTVIRFEVKDSGIGITDDQLARLFNPFSQAESSTTRKYGGTGLGLALSKQIIELMGGRIWVESGKGRGSKFIFTINAARAELADETSEETVEIADGAYSGKVILLADDVEINREIVSSILESTGVTIDNAENGEQAASLFANNPERYSLILMDVQMPVLDGFDASVKIRAGESERAKKVPIIAMTANVFREDVEHCLASGMNAHLGKPVEMNKLFAALNKYMWQNDGDAGL